MLIFLCLLSVFILASSYVLYPAVLALLSVFQRETQNASGDVAAPYEPSVVLVVSAYNESAVIAEKLENCLQLRYRSDRLRVVVFSDGSNDGTDEIVKGYTDRGIELRRVEGRLGKTHCQNTVVSESDEDILVFSDANTLYKADAIQQLVKAFRDDSVGCVIGNRRYTSEASNTNQEGLYERFENWLKAKESLLGGTIGACGAIYAVRRSQYQPLPAERISDIVEPLRIACAGQRVVYCGEAIGEEPLETVFWRELSRKRRIVLRTLNSLWAERAVLLRSPLVCVKLILHKIIRWQTLPLLFLVAVAGVFAGDGIPLLLGLGATAYLVTALGLLAWAFSAHGGSDSPPFGKPGRLLLYSIGVFSSAFLATLGFLRGKNQIVWESRS